MDYDEGMMLEDGKLVEKGDYGPYKQSERADLYAVFAKKSLRMGGEGLPVLHERGGVRGSPAGRQEGGDKEYRLAHRGG